MIQFFALSLLLLHVNSELFDCYENLLVTNTNIIAATASGDAQVGKTSNPDVCFNLKDGDGTLKKCKRLPDNAGYDLEENKADWWDMDYWNGYKLCDMQNFQIVATSSDGWGFNHVMVIIEANDGKSYVAVNWYGPTKWVDQGDANNPSVQQFPIMEEFGKPKGDSTDARMLYVYLITLSTEDTDAEEELHIVSNGVGYHVNLYDLEGDDMDEGKADIWQFEDFDRVTIRNLNDIFIRANAHSNNGWSWERTAVVFETSMGFYVPVLEHKSRSVDRDSGEELKEAHFDIINKWNQELFLPADLISGGYWRYVTAIDPWEDSFTVTETARFYSEKGNIDEKSRMEEYSETYSNGGSFTFCQSAEADFGKISTESEACSETNWNHDQTSGWQTGVTSSIDSRIGGELEVSCEHTFTCPHATIINPDDIPDIISNEEKCYIYMWVTFTQNAKTGHTEVMYTCQFDMIEHYGNTPMCVPGTCIDSDDCQTCHDGPQPPRSPPPEENSIIVGHEKEDNKGESSQGHLTMKDIEKVLANPHVTVGEFCSAYNHIEKAKGDVKNTCLKVCEKKFYWKTEAECETFCESHSTAKSTDHHSHSPAHHPQVKSTPTVAVRLVDGINSRKKFVLYMQLWNTGPQITCDTSDPTFHKLGDLKSGTETRGIVQVRNMQSSDPHQGQYIGNGVVYFKLSNGEPSVTKVDGLKNLGIESLGGGKFNIVLQNLDYSVAIEAEVGSGNEIFGQSYFTMICLSVVCAGVGFGFATYQSRKERLTTHF